MKKVLMIAFHYPPYGGGTGMLRTLKFSNYLSTFGWQPIVLTASPHAYLQTEHKARVPAGVEVTRAFALDTARHLCIAGSHWTGMALPDRWISWWPAAVAQGLALIRKHRPEAIYSTYPISTAHLIALSLHRWSGVPWVADFRDPMVAQDPVTGEIDPSDPLIRRARAWVETHSIRSCTRAVFTTPGTLATYAERFPEIPEDRWAMVPNGYDEEDFGQPQPPPRISPDRPVVLIHSGELYRQGRNPLTLLQALANLRRAGKVSPATVKVILRATADDEYHRENAQRLGINDMVFIEPRLGHREAVAEMGEADGLLLFQGARFNRQIPAKLYEYLRAGRPVFALTDAAGDTAALLKAEGIRSIVPLDSETEIAEGLTKFLAEVRSGTIAARPSVERHSRKARTLELATVLDSVCMRRSTGVRSEAALMLR